LNPPNVRSGLGKMKEDPLVSVVINCYNGEKYLKEAIDSVYEQTYKNWEIIFWDNASTDQTAEIAQSYDEKLRYFRSKETTVLGKARVLAVNETKGEFLAFLDSDDLWLPDKLTEQVGLILSKSNVGVVYGRAELINGDGRNIGYSSDQYKLLPTGDVFSELVKYNFIPFVSALVPKHVYHKCGGFPNHYKNSTDYYLFLKISYNYQIYSVSNICCKYRIHSKNLSKDRFVLSTKEAVNAVTEFLPDKRAVVGLKYQYASMALMYIKERKPFFALSVLFKYGGWAILFIESLKYLKRKTRATR